MLTVKGSWVGTIAREASGFTPPNSPFPDGEEDFEPHGRSGAHHQRAERLRSAGADADAPDHEAGEAEAPHDCRSA